MAKHKENKEYKPETSPVVIDKRYKTNLIRICMLVITIVIIYFCIFVIRLLQDMSEKVTDIQENLHYIIQVLDTNQEDVKNTVKKINKSWLLSW